MENPFHYRNKAQYPLGINKEGETVIGVFANRTHEVIPMQKCLIQNSQSEEIAKFVLQFIKDNNILIYNEQTGKGLFRHMVIKVGIKTNEIMCVLVVNGNQIPKEKDYSDIVVLEACLPHQQNREIKINDSYYGPLSYYIHEIIKNKMITRQTSWIGDVINLFNADKRTFRQKIVCESTIDNGKGF